MTPEQLASLAQSLKDNEAFDEAMKIIRADALERLAGIQYEMRDEFYMNQAIVKVADELRANLEQFIRSGAVPKKPGLA
jgi:hypothetical protein